MSTSPPLDPPPGGSPRSPVGAPTTYIQAPPTALGRYGKWLLAALGVAVMIILGQAASYRKYFSPPGGPQERYHSLSAGADKKIAIITVAGVIMDQQGFVKQQIDRVRDDADVEAVVLRIDSPGGTVTASDYLYHHLKELVRERKLPIVVSMGGLCASGGYYLAMAAGDAPDVLFAEPTTWTGSIGVLIPHYDVSGLLANWGVRDDSIASHEDKLMGSPTRALPPEERAAERALLQKLVDRGFEQFKDVVRTGRPKLQTDDEHFAEATTGQIFTSADALELGLVDRIGFIEDAIKRAAELAGRDEKSLRCVVYDQPPSPIQALLGADHPLQPTGRADLATLLELTAPRAYYLCTWLPSLVGDRR